MKARTVYIIGMMLVAGALRAETRLPRFFTDNMVLQRDREVPVWGWAERGARVRVIFGDKVATATAAGDGRWMTKLPAMPASKEGRQLSVSTAGTSNTVIENVVVGEVWICSGQSNMESYLGAAMNAKQEVAAATFPLIRHVKIPGAFAALPADDVQGTWRVCSPQAAGTFTAVGYFFARKLLEELDVPIGLVGVNWSGSIIEPWIPLEGYRSVSELSNLLQKVESALPGTPRGKAAHRDTLKEIREWLPMAEAAIADERPIPPMPQFPVAGKGRRTPTSIYNAMIHPLLPYAIRGTIWYQGESNGGEGMTYYHKMHVLIGSWRQVWKQGDFPFYFVQLANLGAANNHAAGGGGYSRLREAQLNSLDIPETGMATIIDIGEARNLHPKNKQDVGLRLALWALAKTYGQKDLVHSGPLYKSHNIEDGKIRIRFDHVGSGLMVGKKTGLEPTQEVAGGRLARFALAGADKLWYWADGEIEGDEVLVSSPKVPSPVALRYAFSHNPEGCNLYNREGLPASPFRTDAW